MNPNNPSENLPQPVSPEQSPDNTKPAETLPQRAEAVPPAAEPTQTPVPSPTQAQTPSTPTPATPATTSNEPDQLSAADTDVIEKAWVDKAEKIIEQNQDNPYTEEDQEEKLSQDYQKKRFNIDVNDG